MKYDIVNLNNKSRRGTYLYIKEKGFPSRYFKYTGNPEELEAHINYYKDTIVTKTSKGDLEQYKTNYKKNSRYGKDQIAQDIAKTFQEKIDKASKGNLNKLIGRGTTRTTIPNILRAGQTALKNAKKELLQDLVFDANILDTLIKEENMKKMKYRLEHQIIVKDKYGETLFEAKKFNITLDKLEREINKTIKEGETVQEGEQYGGAIMKLKNAGYQVPEGSKTGTISNITVTSTFRKAK